MIITVKNLVKHRSLFKVFLVVVETRGRCYKIFKGL
jgi:hypothetical protein